MVTLQYRCLAHAYGLNRPFAEQFTRQSWNSIPYDTLLQNHGSKFFALAPMVAFQRASKSDNQTIILDRIRRVFGGLPFIQQTNEFFQHHKLAIICGHILVLVILALLVLSRQT